MWLALDLITDVRRRRSIEQRRTKPSLAVFSMTDPAGRGPHVQFFATPHELIDRSGLHGTAGGSRRGNSATENSCK